VLTIRSPEICTKALRTQDENLIYSAKSKTEIDFSSIGLVIGSGGALSHAPRRAQAAMIMMDALDLVGVTELAVDSVFMLPHLGALTTIHSDAAIDVLYRDCLVSLGTVVTLQGRSISGQIAASVVVEGVEHLIQPGDLVAIPHVGEAKVHIACRAGITIDGHGSITETQLKGGTVGIIIDARTCGESDVPRHTQVLKWLVGIGAYSEDELQGAGGVMKCLVG